MSWKSFICQLLNGFVVFLCINSVSCQSAKILSGICQSPNYPLRYPSNTTSYCDINIENGYHGDVNIAFEFFEIQECSQCQCDRIDILVSTGSTTKISTGSTAKISTGSTTKISTGSTPKISTGSTHSISTFCGSILPNGNGVVKVDDVTGLVRIRFQSNTDHIEKYGYFAKYNISMKPDPTSSPMTTQKTTPVICLPVTCPICPDGQNQSYRYFYNNACPAFCECRIPNAKDNSTELTKIHYGGNCTRIYANNGYIETPPNPYYHKLYPLKYDCILKIDLGNDYRYKDKQVNIRFLKFDIDNCRYSDFVECHCDYLTLINVHGLEGKRICDIAEVPSDRTYSFRPTTRTDRYLTMKFHSDYVIARTGYLIHYNVTEGFSPTCQNETCNLSCSLGYRKDFAGCIICDCVTTTTSVLTTTTPKPTTPTLRKSMLLQKLRSIIDTAQDLYKQIQKSQIINWL